TLPTSNQKSRVHAPTLRPERHDSVKSQLIALSSKSAIVPELRCFSRVAGALLCLFCRKSCGFRLIFGQVGCGRRIGATLPPQICTGWCHEELARIELSPVG